MSALFYLKQVACSTSRFSELLFIERLFKQDIVLRVKYKQRSKENSSFLLDFAEQNEVGTDHRDQTRTRTREGMWGGNDDDCANLPLRHPHHHWKAPWALPVSIWETWYTPVRDGISSWCAEHPGERFFPRPHREFLSTVPRALSLVIRAPATRGRSRTPSHSELCPSAG